MEAARQVRNGALRQVLSWTDSTHRTSLTVDNNQTERNVSRWLLLTLVPSPFQLYNYFRSLSFLSDHLNTLRRTHVIYLVLNMAADLLCRQEEVLPPLHSPLSPREASPAKVKVL